MWGIHKTMSDPKHRDLITTRPLMGKAEVREPLEECFITESGTHEDLNSTKNAGPGVHPSLKIYLSVQTRIYYLSPQTT